MQSGLRTIQKVARRIGVLVAARAAPARKLVAQAIPKRADRGARGPSVAVNCAALQEDLVESEVFGTRKCLQRSDATGA